MSELLRREAATNATLAKYRPRVFDWRTRATCIHMARFHMRQMGHKPPSIPDFRSPRGARTALEATGFATLADLLDSLLPRIAPASMWLGDLAIMPGEPDDGGFDCIVMNGGSKLFGWSPEYPKQGIVPAVVDPFHLIGAWRL